MNLKEKVQKYLKEDQEQKLSPIDTKWLEFRKDEPRRSFYKNDASGELEYLQAAIAWESKYQNYTRTEFKDNPEHIEKAIKGSQYRINMFKERMAKLRNRTIKK